MPEISETLKGYLRNVSVLWDKTISTENRDSPRLSFP